MQTFLPEPTFALAVSRLDRQRLGKQRVEAMQILKALVDPTYGWQHHPAVRMWRGFEANLRGYYNTCLFEWCTHGYKNTMAVANDTLYDPPPWLTPAFIASHRSNLLRKDPSWYAQFGWNVPNDLPYVWPTGETNAQG